jgi:hypothetical protein
MACGLGTSGLGDSTASDDASEVPDGTSVDGTSPGDAGDATAPDGGDAKPYSDAADAPNPTEAATDAPADGCPPCGVQSICIGGTCIAARRVFISEYGHDGTLSGGGVDAGDLVCIQRAMMTNLGGTWMAWVSDSKQAATDRLVHSPVGYYMLDGTQVASDWNGLTSGNIMHPIDVNAYLVKNSGVTVWTGTQPNGTLALPNCGDFTSNDPMVGGVYGDNTKTDGKWTNASSQGGCDQLRHVYCFEQ